MDHYQQGIINIIEPSLFEDFKLIGRLPNSETNTLEVSVQPDDNEEDVVADAMVQLRVQTLKEVILVGSAPSDEKTIKCADMIWSTSKDLYYLKRTGTIRVEEMWEPSANGALNSLQVIRETPTTGVLLTRYKLSPQIQAEPGYKPARGSIYSPRSKSYKGKFDECNVSRHDLPSRSHNISTRSDSSSKSDRGKSLRSNRPRPHSLSISDFSTDLQASSHSQGDNSSKNKGRHPLPRTNPNDITSLSVTVKAEKSSSSLEDECKPLRVELECDEVQVDVDSIVTDKLGSTNKKSRGQGHHRARGDYEHSNRERHPPNSSTKDRNTPRGRNNFRGHHRGGRTNPPSQFRPKNSNEHRYISPNTEAEEHGNAMDSNSSKDTSLTSNTNVNRGPSNHQRGQHRGAHRHQNTNYYNTEFGNPQYPPYNQPYYPEDYHYKPAHRGHNYIEPNRHYASYDNYAQPNYNPARRGKNHRGGSRHDTDRSRERKESRGSDSERLPDSADLSANQNDANGDSKPSDGHGVTS